MTTLTTYDYPLESGEVWSQVHGLQEGLNREESYFRRDLLKYRDAPICPILILD